MIRAETFKRTDRAEQNPRRIAADFEDGRQNIRHREGQPKIFWIVRKFGDRCAVVDHGQQCCAPTPSWTKNIARLAWQWSECQQTRRSSDLTFNLEAQFCCRMLRNPTLGAWTELQRCLRYFARSASDVVRLNRPRLHSRAQTMVILRLRLRNDWPTKLKLVQRWRFECAVLSSETQETSM